MDRYGYHSLEHLAFEPDELEATSEGPPRPKLARDPVPADHPPTAPRQHPTQLQAGQTIHIPAPSYSPPNVQWTVQPGENLTRIIRALQATDTNFDKIAAANPCQLSGHGVCQPGYEIFPGDTLTIPFH